MQDMMGQELSVGDVVVHVQKASTSVRVQRGIVTELGVRPGCWDSRYSSLKMRRLWTNGWQPLDKETPWMYTSNVMKI